MGFFEIVIWTGIYFFVPIAMVGAAAAMAADGIKGRSVIGVLLATAVFIFLPDALKEEAVLSICGLWNGKGRSGSSPGEFPICQRFVGYAYLVSMPSGRDVKKRIDQGLEKVSNVGATAEKESRKTRLASLLPTLAYEHRKDIRELAGREAMTFPLPRDGASVYVVLPAQGTMFEGRRVSAAVNACASGNPLFVLAPAQCLTICAAGVSSSQCSVTSGEPFSVGSGVPSISVRNADADSNLAVFQVYAR